MTQLTKLIEETRKDHKVSVSWLAWRMNITPRTYYRKLESKDGFNESELIPAMTALRMKLVVVRNIDYVMIEDPALILDDEKMQEGKVVMQGLKPGWREASAGRTKPHTK